MVSSHRLMAVAVGIVAAAPLAAQKSVPATYAITNARIVPVSGPAIEKGTIVMRDGIITAVGASAAVPADARIVDGAGLTVYPGLIDAYGTLGMATAAPAAGAAGGAAGGRGGRGGAAATTGPSGAPNSNYGIGLQPEIRAVDELDPSEGAFDAAHAAGFTSALTSSGSGIFRGSSALINLDGDDVSAMVIKPGIAQHIGFSRGAGGGRGGGGGGGGYPGSLMGVFAQLRQELLDAQHYRDVKAAYDKNSRGMKRPDYDPSLEALLPVLAGKQPVVMQANTQREIERALDLAKEFSLKAVIAGGSEAPKMIARLKAENVPVLLSVNFPRAGAGGGGGFGGGGGRGASPDDPEPLRLLRDRVEAPKAANALAAAGVKFAVQSGANFTEFLGNMRKAVDAGLPADLALKSVTTQPAELFGVGDRLGTIEVGKIANLTVTRGDLFDPAGRVTQVFVDGKPIAVTATAGGTGGGGRGGRGGGGGFSATGRWSVTVSVDGRDRAVTFELRQDGDRLYGVIQGSLGAAEILEGGVDKDGSFFFTTTVSLGSSSIEAEFDGTIDRTGLHGSVSIEDHKTGAFSGSHTN